MRVLCPGQFNREDAGLAGEAKVGFADGLAGGNGVDGGRVDVYSALDDVLQSAEPS